MSAVATQSFLAANLACLGERNADLAEKLRAIEPHPGILFAPTLHGVPSATLDGRQLCSRHDPIEEALRQTEAIDLVEHAAIVVLGFGLGYHVQKLAERSAKATLIIVFEPDLALLRAALEHIDHSQWLKDGLVLFITDAADRGLLAEKLNGAESILAQGVHFFEHPASRVRLRENAAEFSALFTEFITAAKTTLMTTLMRSVDTTRNLMLNLDHYAGGAGILALRNAAAGHPAVVVSAGPSLHKNIHELKLPGVRDRCVIIAVQTTLKPLLEAGVKPHFVTALDYHEISKRFYEGLNPEDLHDVTLIADPKAHPVILDSFPGPIRCCSNPFVDKLLGPLKREMGDLPAGATVAHLALYVAKHLGCNPIALIGQDLGFTDGLYYAPTPGIAIHDVWAPELNPFNTIEMMEWQRIARHRVHLRKLKDVHGKSIYTDAQMHTYLQQFERDFAQCKREGLAIIDATEGGVAKQHTLAMPLREVLDKHASSTPLPHIPSPPLPLDQKRLSEARQHLEKVRSEVRRLREISKQTAGLLREMIDDQNNLAKMARHFEKVERNRKEVEALLDIFELLNHLNQLGVFNRMKADRRLHMQQHLSPLAKQRAQLERDLTNVTWIADAAQEMIEQLELSERLLEGRPSNAAKPNANKRETNDLSPWAGKSKIAALIPIDPHRNGLGRPRSMATLFDGRTVLQATLERLGQSQRLDSIILIVPDDFDVESLVKRDRIAVAIEVERVHGSPFGPEHKAIAAARLWAQTCWRGGIAGMSIYDEALCPPIMHPIMQKRGLTAALIVGPDWPLVQVREKGGCDDVIARHLEHPQEHNLVFTQSPPGLCGCLISAKLMQELSQRNRLSTVGGLLVYQPHAPQGDPIARECCVHIEPAVRNSLIRATFDSPRQVKLLQSLAGANGSAAESIAQLEAACLLAHSPTHAVIELCTARATHGDRFNRHPFGPITRPPLSLEIAEQIFTELREFNTDDLVITFAGMGDPLLHPQFDEIVRLAKKTAAAVQVRTDLLADQSILDRLLACEPDVISVNLNADRAATYQQMMGADRFKEVLLNIEYLLEHRRKLTQHPGTAAFALPWIVPHLQRCSETYEDIDTFFDRWQHTLGCAVVEGIPPFDHDPDLAPAITPPRVLEKTARTTVTIFCDGGVPFDGWDWACREKAGVIGASPLCEIWQSIIHRCGPT